jgi:hypothetical protein
MYASIGPNISPVDPSGIEEGNLILDGYVQAGKDAWGSGKK